VPSAARRSPHEGERRSPARGRNWHPNYTVPDTPWSRGPAPRGMVSPSPGESTGNCARRTVHAGCLDARGLTGVRCEPLPERVHRAVVHTHLADGIHAEAEVARMRRIGADGSRERSSFAVVQPCVSWDQTARCRHGTMRRLRAAVTEPWRRDGGNRPRHRRMRRPMRRELIRFGRTGGMQLD
jgi:hypothetical protein